MLKFVHNINIYAEVFLMYYLLKLDQFPTITQFYSVTRNTVWQIADADHILIVIREGRCTIEFDNETYLLKPGDIFFIPANHSYTRRSIDGTMCTMTYIHFSLPSTVQELFFSEMDRLLLDAKNTLDAQLISNDSVLSVQHNLYLKNHYSFSNPQTSTNFLKEIQLFSSKRQLMCGLQSSISLCSILSLMSQHTIETISTDTALHQPSKVPDNLKKAIRYIRSHYTERISLDDLAEHCSVSKQQLIRYFHATFHCTPIAYIIDYKISNAKNLLFNHPHLTIKEISDELGFNNQHYFTKVFQKVTGETPSHYRDRTLHYYEQHPEVPRT